MTKSAQFMADDCDQTIFDGLRVRSNQKKAEHILFPITLQITEYDEC